MSQVSWVKQMTALTPEWKDCPLFSCWDCCVDFDDWWECRPGQWQSRFSKKHWKTHWKPGSSDRKSAWLFLHKTLVVRPKSLIWKTWEARRWTKPVRWYSGRLGAPRLMMMMMMKQRQSFQSRLVVGIEITLWIRTRWGGGRGSGVT